MQCIARVKYWKIPEYCEDRLFFHQEGKELKLWEKKKNIYASVMVKMQSKLDCDRILEKKVHLILMLAAFLFEWHRG